MINNDGVTTINHFNLTYFLSEQRHFIYLFILFNFFSRFFLA